jgi:FMN phosphatase YigB (HAD superfamily)
VGASGRRVRGGRTRSGEKTRVKSGFVFPILPETRTVVCALLERVPVAVATNAFIPLANVAVTTLGTALPTVVIVEEVGYYKPHLPPTI